MRQVTRLTGSELKAARRAAGFSQAEMGRLIGCTRHSVSYWETKPLPLDFKAVKWGVPARMLEVLGIEVLPDYRSPTRARGGGVLAWPAWTDRQQAAADREGARIEARAAERQARHRQPCGARTRKGHPCRNMSEAGKRRCKFHGGMSTGPRTPEGRARIAQAQRQRWAAYRQARKEGRAGS